MDDLLAAISTKKAQLDRLRPMSEAALRGLQKYFDVDLTYTSNAIEGNTLTLRETAEVIEHGITVGGKPLKDHLEAVDHYEAVLWMRDLAARSVPLGESVVRELHRRVVARSEPEIAGLYSRHPRRVAGSPVVFPNAAKLPELMQAFGNWLPTAPPTPSAAFDAHFRLTAIHPFSDGNGRTARLLMNLLLMRAGYVPVTVRPEDRSTYLDALEQGSLKDDLVPFQTFMHKRLDDALGAYLQALHDGPPSEQV
jgi:Fic family protein